MHRVNLLTFIAEHLSWQDLLNFSLLNRTCYQIAQCEDLWKRECLRVWTSSDEFYGEVILGKIPLEKPSASCRWKLLMKKGAVAFALWKRLLDSDFLSERDVVEVATACFEMLREPVPRSPMLRREARAYCTAMQDFLAYRHIDPPPFPEPEVSLFFDALESSSYELAHEFESTEDCELLAVARWHAVNQKAESAPSTAASSLTSSDIAGEVQPLLSDLNCGQALTFRPSKLRKSRSTLLCIYYALKKAASFFCQLHLRQLQDSRDGLNLLSRYVQLWNSFSTSAIAVEGLFTQYAAALGGVYRDKWTNLEPLPEFSIAKMMVGTWRRKVFSPLETPLFDAYSVLLDAQRSSAQSRGCKKVSLDDKEMVALMSATQAMVDLSVHEGNVHYLEHSLFRADGPYTRVHSLILDGTEPLLSSDCVQSFATDLKFLRRFALSCTLHTAELLYAQRELSLLSRQLCSPYLTASWPLTTHLRSHRTAQEFTNSEFGAQLFRSGGDRERVERFVEFLLAVDADNLARLQRWGELNETVNGESEWDVRDEEIEHQAKRLCPYAPQGDSPLFSLHVTPAHLSKLLSLRHPMQLCD